MTKGYIEGKKQVRCQKGLQIQRYHSVTWFGSESNFCRNPFVASLIFKPWKQLWSSVFVNLKTVFDTFNNEESTLWVIITWYSRSAEEFGLLSSNLLTLLHWLIYDHCVISAVWGRLPEEEMPQSKPKDACEGLWIAVNPRIQWDESTNTMTTEIFCWKRRKGHTGSCRRRSWFMRDSQKTGTFNPLK